MKQRNIRGTWLSKLLKTLKKCTHIRYALVDKTGYVCCVYHDRISATTAASDMNGTNVEEKPFRVKRVISFSWF